MAKDPILPLYYNDITSSTQDWTDEEFGAFIRLLIYQWDKGALPEENRISRISDSAKKNWPILCKKFSKTDLGLQNLRMEEIRNDRIRFKEKQKENVTKRYQKSTKNLPKYEINHSKNLPLEEEEEKEVENEEEKENEFAEGNFLNNLMMRTFKEYIPDYPESPEHDARPLRIISDFICKQQKIIEDPALDEVAKRTVLLIWRQLCMFIGSDKFHKTQSLITLSNHIQSISLKTKNATDTNSTSKAFNGAGLNEVLDSFND